MPERVYSDLDLDLDDLADAIVDWFEHDGFEVQDFQEGPAIFIQARKQNLMTTLSATSQALNVRLAPLSAGFKVQVGSGEWLDKGVGAIASVALKFLNPLLAVGTAAATGYGVYKQLKLPELLLDFIDMYVDRHAAPRPDREVSERRPRREPAAAGAPTPAEPPPGTGARFCPQCGAAVKPADRFCASCGARLEAAAEPVG
ncbi:MAG: zinc ribbon domain-containing protein [Fimbriimonadaceae bacterium]|nr:zinc ribbon domain-containing protein [Fimbriimonadaceae bacterium]